MVVKIGIDTGGTYTDAVLFDDKAGVLAQAKALTTRQDLSIGIENVLNSVLASAASDLKSQDIALVSLSTTLATNAIVESMGFPVALVLIGQDSSVVERSDIKSALGKDPVLFIDGGHNAQGEEKSPLDEDSLKAKLSQIEDKVSAIAISGFFGLRNPAHENRARDIIRQQTDLPVTCACELSARLDAPRRALTALLNARLIPLIQHLVQSVEQIMARHKIDAPLMIVKGDGSLITSGAALSKPVETILSGPAASIVGAQFLCKKADMTVCDIGGTTTDIAIVRNSQPMLADDGARINGFQTMVEAVNIHTVGLGGDSEVRLDRTKGFIIGPRRNMPISLLAMEHEELVFSTLNRQKQRGYPKMRDGEFAVGAFKMTAALARGLSKSEQALMDRLDEGPISLEKLFSKNQSERSLNRLLDTGLVIKCGFTPTDASHILGHQHHWNDDAAALGGDVWAAKETFNGIRWSEDGHSLAKTVYQLVTLQSAEAIIEASLPDNIIGSVPLGSQSDSLQKIIRGSLQFPDEESPSICSFRPVFDGPIIGIGAPAATYYPDVARRLNSSAVLPEYAAVCNAIGAVVGEISQKSVVTITAPQEGLFRVHAPNGNLDFNNLDQALHEATGQAEQAVRAKATAAGADNIQLETSRFDQAADIGGGTKMFLETRITATAHGRPRLS